MTKVQIYIAVWLSLLVLLAITAVSSRVDLGGFNVAINLAVAGAKSLLILTVYMRLSQSAALPRLAVACMGLWLAILYGLTMSDYATR